VSEERGKRDSGTAGSNPGDAGTTTGATPDDSSAVARPSGKRVARGSSGGARVSVAKDSDSASARRSGSVTEVDASSGDKKPENIFKRLRRYFREVIAELRKVIWPNRKQLTTYTIVVVVFVTVMTAFIFGMDLAFVQGVSWLFG